MSNNLDMSKFVFNFDPSIIEKLNENPDLNEFPPLTTEDFLNLPTIQGYDRKPNELYLKKPEDIKEEKKDDENKNNLDNNNE